MLINDRYNRFLRNSLRREGLQSANQNDLQNTKSLRVSNNPRSYVDQRARTENYRMYAEAMRKQPKTFQDKFERIGMDVLRDAVKILNGDKK